MEAPQEGPEGHAQLPYVLSQLRDQILNYPAYWATNRLVEGKSDLIPQ